MFDSFHDLIERWPTTADLAEDLGEKPWTVQKWKQRNSIPSDRWLDLLVCAKRRKIKLKEVDLVLLASRKSVA